ncbi:Lysosomal thioesterase ppt2-b [Globisporangium polare]
MFGKVTSIATAILAASLCLTAQAAATTSKHLPVFFFHGATGDHTNGDTIGRNLTGDGRTFVALSFCESECSVQTALADQVQLAIKQIKGIVTGNATFANGYHFMGHSTGGSIARWVIEEWNDHNVHSFISLAGDGNGGFYGPQKSDQVPLQVLLQALGPYVLAEKEFNWTKYEADSSSWNGKVQRDLVELVSTRRDLQASNSIIENIRAPVSGQNAGWMVNGTFLPIINNLQDCGKNATCKSEQQRRKTNFLKLKAAHFFASPGDDIQSPWQTSILGRYTEVATVNEVETKFSTLKIIAMNETAEYTKDLYGLQTFDKAGKLHLHPVAGVGHNCWLFDYLPQNTNVTCLHDPIFGANVYPVLV